MKSLKRFFSQKLVNAFLMGIVLIGLYLTSLYSYLLFHTIAEFFSIIVACAMFMIAWNSKKYIQNSYLIFIAVAYLFIANLDLLHTLSYKGMNIFRDYDFYANQLWIAARFIESLTLLVAFVVLHYIQKPGERFIYSLFAVYVIISFFVIASVFYWKTFPICFIEGQGLTPFKKMSEYIICLILLTDLTLLIINRRYFEEKILRFLVMSIICTIISELAFTFYISNYGLSNLVGHYFKIFSFYCIYKAIIQTGIINPYDLIFRELIHKEERLIEAKKIADSANSAKSEFLANMSHELRTPLNGVLGYTQILKRDEQLSVFQKNGLNVIERSGRHLLNLINEILDLSKIEAKKMELLPSTIQLIPFLSDISKIIDIKAKEKNLYFKYQFDNSLPEFVSADEKRLSQVLLNLLGNAVKYTNVGGINFMVHPKENSDQTNMSHIQHHPINRIVFKIEDTGFGIPEDMIDNIFSPFVQLKEHARTIEDTGLGLSICRKLVQLMGGELHVKSQVNKGSVFWFDIELPIISGKKKQTVNNKLDQIIGYKGEIKRILIVDDKKENRNVLSTFLTLLNFQVKEAQNGQECIHSAKEWQPDLIFMDLVMPVLDGFEATRKLREEKYTNPIIAVSASLAFSSIDHYTSCGFNQFISKPIDFKKVLDNITQFLSIEWVYQSSEEPTQKQDINNSTKQLPPKAMIEKLYHFALMGNIIEINNQLAILESQSDQYIELINDLKNLSSEFKINQIKTMLDRIMKETE